MDDFTKDLIRFCLGVAILIVFLGYLMVQLVAAECLHKAKSFKDSEYKFVGGCMVQLDDDRWIPLGNYIVTKEDQKP